MSAARRGRPTFGPLSQGPRNGPLFALVALGCFAAVGAALVSQHVYGMEPCPWCVLQRLVFLAIGAFALLGLVWRGPAGTRVVGTLGLLLAAVGLAAALWQHFVAAQSASCNLTLADRIVNATGLNALLPGVFEARASCADAAVSLLGVPYDLWSGALFAADRDPDGRRLAPRLSRALGPVAQQALSRSLHRRAQRDFVVDRLEQREHRRFRIGARHQGLADRLRRAQPLVDDDRRVDLDLRHVRRLEDVEPLVEGVGAVVNDLLHGNSSAWGANAKDRS